MVGARARPESHVPLSDDSRDVPRKKIEPLERICSRNVAHFSSCSMVPQRQDFRQRIAWITSRVGIVVTPAWSWLTFYLKWLSGLTRI